MDKPISQLNLVAALSGLLMIPTAKVGSIVTEAFTIEMLIDFISENLSGDFQQLTSGVANPDNANGSNGDIYLKFVPGESLGFWQKSADQWNEKANISLDSGASSFEELEGDPDDNTALAEKFSTESSARLAADNLLTEAIETEIEDRQEADTQNLIEAKAYADLVSTDVLRYAGQWNATTGTYPTAGSGTGTAGAIRRGDTFEISVEGTIDGNEYEVGDQLRAKVETPGQTGSNWSTGQTNTQQATTLKSGIARMATPSEGIAGASSLLMMNPVSTKASILDEKKYFIKEVYVLSVLEIIFPMQLAGQISNIQASAAMNSVQYKIGSAGTYAAFAGSFSYAANAEIYIRWNYVSQTETRGWVRLTGKDN